MTPSLPRCARLSIQATPAALPRTECSSVYGRLLVSEQLGPYLDDLEACCQMVADDPTLGRACDDIRPGLRRMERGRLVVFYRQDAGGILVSRILH